MLFDFATIPARERYKLLISTVVPRPIAWIVSQNLEGQLNAAPFSFFNAFAGDPPVVGIGIGSHDPGRPKDTRRNIRDTAVRSQPRLGGNSGSDERHGDRVRGRSQRDC